MVGEERYASPKQVEQAQFRRNVSVFTYDHSLRTEKLCTRIYNENAPVVQILCSTGANKMVLKLLVVGKECQLQC